MKRVINDVLPTARESAGGDEELVRLSGHTTLFAEKYQPVRDRVSMCGFWAKQEAAAYLNFLRGFEYDPTVDCDAILGV